MCYVIKKSWKVSIGHLSYVSSSIFSFTQLWLDHCWEQYILGIWWLRSWIMWSNNLSLQHQYLQGNRPRTIERRMDSVFHKTEMKIWAGQNFLAAHIVLPKGQHLLSWWLNYVFKFICFSNFTFQFMIYVNFAKGA